MNLVLLVNSHNLAEIQAFITAAAASQHDKCPGALAVVYQQRLGADFIGELVAPLLARFSAGASIPVTVNSELSNDARNATLFALFLAQGYARFPGPWLVVDGPALPKGENFIQALTKQHKVLGGDASGRVTQDGSSMIPVGPVVLAIPVNKLSWFSPGSTESWRVKSRFLLARCGFKIVPLEDYLFSIPGAARTTPEPEPDLFTQTVATIPVAPVFNPAVLDVQAESTILTYPILRSPAGELAIGQAEVASTHVEPVLRQPNLQVIPYSEMTREMLLELIADRRLPAPHHSTGLVKLAALLEASDSNLPV